MGFKDKLDKYKLDAYMKKYGHRTTNISGTVLSVKTETKSILGIFNKIRVLLVIKPEAGKQVVKCEFNRIKWFKKPTFIDVNQGHKVFIIGIKGIKGKANSDIVAIQNIANFTTKKDLYPFDHAQFKKARQQAIKMRSR